MKDVQATEEAISPQKKTSSTSKLEFLPFSVFYGSFFPPVSGSGSSRPKSMQDYADPEHGFEILQILI
jgi:hypothetical protein